MSEVFLAVLTAVVAVIASMAVYPFVLRFARKHSVYDNPNERKLQRSPVPVMGGIAVFVGILAAMSFAEIFVDFEVRWLGVVSFTVMLAVGLWDDIRDVPAGLRFLIEIFVVWMIISTMKIGLDNLHGLWGVGFVSPYFSSPLSILAGVGIINAINLIDGVDGYSSGYCIMACGLFAILFFSVGLYRTGLFALACAGALLPFFLHNVFGLKSKMFIGDSGTLMLGTIMSLFVFIVISGRSDYSSALENRGFGTVAFTLAVLAIPVFDTLRVMGARIIRGRSPFEPDRTHLHHLFIDAGFSHVGTAFHIVMLNLLIVLIWFASWLLGASVEFQFYVVVALGILFTFVFYRFMRIQQNKGLFFWKWMLRAGNRSHIERRRVWKVIRNMVDNSLLGGGIIRK